MKIVIIGTGNAATVLGRAIKNAGHTILQVAGRNAAYTSRLALLLEAEVCLDFSAIVRGADLYIAAVSDGALENAGEWLSLTNELVVHTGGAVSKEVLKKVSINYGVLYPLQSLRADREAIPEIPFLIEASSGQTLEAIRSFAVTLSAQVQYMDENGRMKLHAAAVITNNFTNFLYTLADDFCRKGGIDFTLLLPLITETADRIKQYPPAQMQTGPAVRNDLQTIEKHINLLRDYPELANVYATLSDGIRRYYTRAIL